MTKLRDFWRWSERVQDRFGVRVVLAVLSLAVIGGSLGQIALRAGSINRDRNAILEALTTTSLMAGDDVARSLKEKGTFEAGGREWGDVSLRDASGAIFGPDGRVAIPLEVAEYCLRNEAPSWAPAWLVTQPQTARLGAVSIAAFVLLVVVLRGFHELLLTGLLTAGAAFLARSLGLLDLGWALAGIGVLGWSFLLLLRAARTGLSGRGGIRATAQLVLMEGARTGLPLVFIVVMLVVLPLIPLSLDPDAPLRYRVQTFMSWSLGLAFWLAALMTLLLGCSTIATEIRDRQIWQVVTKPISRLRWLVGKWLGLAVLNFVLTATSCVSIFFFIQYLRSQPTAEGLAGREDSFLLQETVLTARAGAFPTWDELDNEQLRQRISQIEETDPEIRARGGMGINERRAAVQELRELHNSLQRTVPPAVAGAPPNYFVFNGLSAAKDLGGTLTIRSIFHILRDDEHERYQCRFIFDRGGGEQPIAVDQTFVPTMSHVFQVPAEWVDDEGALRMAIQNLAPAAINFDPDDLEILYRVSSFESNFLRAALVHWSKLAFLAALAVACATALGFPVACLASITIFLAGSAAPFLARALYWYAPAEMNEIDFSDTAAGISWVFEVIIHQLAVAMTWAFGAFGDYDPTGALVRGRHLPWSEVFNAFARMLLFWTGGSLLFGWRVLTRRQLAIYSGSG